MINRRLLLAGFAALALAACQQSETAQCDDGKCDEQAQSLDGVMPRAPATPGAISLVRDGDAFRFQVIGDRGAIVLLSKGFTERASAINGVVRAQEAGVAAESYTVVESAGGFTVQLVAGGDVLATGEAFATEAEALAAAGQARDLVAGIVQYRAALADGAQFELGRNGKEWEFTLKDEQGKPVLLSQGYARRTAAITGIESVRVNGKNASRWEVDGSRFILKAANGKEIAESSTTFASPAEAEATIASLQTLLASERVANPW